MLAPWRWALGIVAAFAVMMLAGCANTPDKATWDAATYYEESRALIEDNTYSLAIDLYDELQLKYPYGEYSEKAWLDKAYAYFKIGRLTAAELELEEFLRNYPRHENADYALFALGYLHEAHLDNFMLRRVNEPSDIEMEKIEDALRDYDRLLRQYQDTPYRAQAITNITALTNIAATHHYRIAEYYIARDAWIAGLARAEFVVNAYPESAVAADAAALIVEAYRVLQLPDIAEDVAVFYADRYQNPTESAQIIPS